MSPKVLKIMKEQKAAGISDSNAAFVVLDPETAPSAPVAHSTEVNPQSNSEEALP